MTAQNEPHRLPRGPRRPPSDRSVGRLRADLTAELTDLRDVVGDELRLVQVLRDAGEVDAARLLLDRPSRRLELSQQRLRDLVARAAVERAAEGVLAGVRERSEPRTRERSEPRRGPRVRRLQRAPVLLAGAVAVALAMVVSPPDVPAPTSAPMATLGAGSVTTPATDAGSAQRHVAALPPPSGMAGAPASLLGLDEVGGARLVGDDLAVGPAPRPPTVLLGLLDPAVFALRGAAGEASAEPPVASATSLLGSDGGNHGEADGVGGDVPGSNPQGHAGGDAGIAERTTDEAARSVPPAEGDVAVPLGDAGDALEGDAAGDLADADVVSGVDGR